jgi:uncharacterized protein YabN with tetrapyrrole methylase and pyrophosphatase domain
VSGSGEVLRNWARIKSEERKDSGDNSVVAGVPRALPALLRAHRLGEKAAHIGFDWSNAEEVLAKVDEELAELRSAIAAGDADASRQEIGDLLLALASLGRHLGTHGEDALQQASDRFIERFRYVERRLGEMQRDPHDATPEELNRLWDEAKRSSPASS